jgi:F-type H+-transporting ATPase subunit delta
MMPAGIEGQLAVARVYAEALFELAREAGQIKETRSELEELVQLTERTPEFGALLTGVGTGTDRRAVALEQLFRGRVSDRALNTLHVLNRHRRTELLPALARAFCEIQELAADQVEAVATTAVELAPDEKEAVVKVAAALSGKHALVRFVVDPRVVGGLILQIADWRWDYSLRRQLAGLHGRLRARGERGLQVGVRA